MKIRKNTISKATAFLNDLASLSNGGGHFTGVQIMEFRRNRKINSNLIPIAKEIGFIKKAGKKKYKMSLQKYDPIHGRRLLENMYIKFPALTQKKIVQVTEKPKTDKKPIRYKTTSILWGLFKFKTPIN